MTDEAATDAGQQNRVEAPVPALEVGHQYIKDLSFEVPGAPGSFDEKTTPEVGVNVDVAVAPLDEKSFEVCLRIDARGETGGKTLFIAQLEYAGLFRVGDTPKEHVQPLLMIEAPRLLFPFARNIIASVTRDGGLPPLMINPIDFVALFRRHVAAAQADAARAQSDGNGGDSAGNGNGNGADDQG